MTTVAASIDAYMHEPGGIRLRSLVAAGVVLAHVGAIAWIVSPGKEAPPVDTGAMQMVFVAPPEQETTPPPPAPKVEQPPILATKRQVQAAPEAPVIPPEPTPDAPPQETKQEAPVAPPAPPTPAAPTEIPVDVRAAYANNPKPSYPLSSKRLNEQGVSRLRVLVGSDGRVQQIELEKSSGFSRLDQAAMATVRDWKFAPARRGDSAFSTWVIVPINWKLEK